MAIDTYEADLYSADEYTASALTFSRTSLNPEDTVGVSLSVASSCLRHEIKWSLGNSSVTHTLSEGVIKDAFTVPLSWAEEITSSQSGNISIRLITYNGTEKIGSRDYFLKLVIPASEKFLPDFQLVAERIDNSVSVEIGEYIKGKSQVKLLIDNLSLKHGAEVASYTARVGNACENTVPAIFDLTKSGEVTVSITLKDSRGFSVTKSSKINVLDYSAPSVSINSACRCDENGSKTINGTYALVDLTPFYSSVNNKNAPEIICKYKKTGTAIYSDAVSVTEGTCIIGEGDFLNNSSYILAFRITDSITTDNDFVEVLVSATDIPFNIKKGGRGAAFGCYAEKNNELTVAWDLNVKGDLVYENVATEITSLVTDKRGIARYIPCMELVIVRMRFTANQVIPSGSAHTVAFLGKAPALFTPVTVSIGTGYEKNGRGGIKSETGELVISADKAIDEGEYIYVSGVYFAYRN